MCYLIKEMTNTAVFDLFLLLVYFMFIFYNIISYIYSIKQSY